MIEYARKNAEKMKIQAEYEIMDTHSLHFTEISFDLIISRDVTWTLHNPIIAYREWIRVLKPSGLLLICDTNWHLYQYDSFIMEEVVR